MAKKIFSMAPPETAAEKKKRLASATPAPVVVVPLPVEKPKKKRTIANLRLWGDRVLIEQEKAPDAIKGIIVPETSKNKPARGIIKAVGAKCTEAKVGETVYFGKYAGTPIPLNEGEELLILREADVFMSDGNV